MCSIQQSCCTIHGSAQSNCSLSYEYYNLSKLYVPYSGKNCIDLSVNLRECVGLGWQVDSKNVNYYINFNLNYCCCFPNKSNLYTVYIYIPRASMGLEDTSDPICCEQIFILLHCHLTYQVPWTKLVTMVKHVLQRTNTEKFLFKIR